MAAAHDPSVDPASAEAGPLPDLRTGGAVRRRHEVERSVDIDGDLDDVWSVLTEQGGLSSWLGADVDLEVRPGAAGRVTDPDGAQRQVLVTDVEANRVAWHWWQEDGPLSSVEIIAVRTGSGTRVTVVERLETLVPAAPGLAQGPSAHRAPTTRVGGGCTGGAGSLRLEDDPVAGPVAAAWTLRLARLRVAAARPRHTALVG